MNQRKHLNQKRLRRTARTRAKVFGSAARPRLAVFRSNKYFSAQLIDDEQGRTIVHVSSKGLAAPGESGSKAAKAQKAGEILAQKAKGLGVADAVFDRRHYKYHGRVKAFVDGARKAGLKI